jgi:hypothetical protein
MPEAWEAAALPIDDIHYVTLPIIYSDDSTVALSPVESSPGRGMVGFEVSTDPRPEPKQCFLYLHLSFH